MTANRFEFLGDSIKDNLDDTEILCNKDGFQDVCDLLNAQHESNQLLTNGQDKYVTELENSLEGLLKWKKKVRETLQEAYTQNARHSNPISIGACWMLKNIAYELGV